MAPTPLGTPSTRSQTPSARSHKTPLISRGYNSCPATPADHDNEGRSSPSSSRCLSPVFPVPSEWGRRGSPTALRKVTLGIRHGGVPLILPDACKGKRVRPHPPRPSSEASNRPSRTQVHEVCMLVRELLSRCSTVGEVAKVYGLAEKVMFGRSRNAVMDSSNLSGPLVYSLRQALEGMRITSFAHLSESCRQTIHEVLIREAERRQNELGLGIGDESALIGATLGATPPPAVEAEPNSDMWMRMAFQTPATSAATATKPDHQISREPSMKKPTVSVDRPARFGRSTTFAEGAGDATLPEVGNKWQKVFKKFKDDGKVHRDDLLRVVEGSGFPAYPYIVTSVFSQVSDGYTTLDQTQFLAFMVVYAQKINQIQKEAFNSCDADGSGSVDVTELADLLRHCGMEPMTHVLFECVTEVDEDASGVLEFEEFDRLMALMRGREGFSRSEYEVFTNLFYKFDKDASGEVDVMELHTILTWLGYTCPRDKVDAIVEKVDANGSGELDLREFLMCMRKVRELELETIKDAMASSEKNDSGNIARKDVAGVLRALDYSPDMTAVWETARDVGISNDDNDIDLGEFWQLLTKFRERGGFSAAERAEFAEGFAKYDRGNEGEIPNVKVAMLLRWLGYLTSTEMKNSLIAKVDLDGSGMLDLSELTKLIRMLNSADLQVTREIFEKYDPEETGYLTLEGSKLAFRAAGCMDDWGKMPELAQTDLVPSAMISSTIGTKSSKKADKNRPFLTATGFERTVVNHRRKARQKFKRNGGYSSDEVEQLQVLFAHYDKDRSGDINSGELVVIIQEFCPKLAQDPATRPQLLSMLKEVDSDGSGTLDFREFITLMGRLRELEQREQIDKERLAVDETGLSLSEVEEFREIFLANTGGASLLAATELRKMLGAICPLGDRNLSDLQNHINVVLIERKKKERCKDWTKMEIDFPEFLWLFHRLMSQNFAEIRDRVTFIPPP